MDFPFDAFIKGEKTMEEHSYKVQKKSAAPALATIFGIVSLALLGIVVYVILQGHVIFDTPDEITISDDGYLVVNGVKTTHLVKNRYHTFGDWMLYGEEGMDCEKKMYFRVCSDCSEYEWKEGEYEDHKFSTVTTAPGCTVGGFDTKTCLSCGKVEITNETPVVPHDYSSPYLNDDNYHWKQCKVCQNVEYKGEHTLDGNGSCSVCSLVLSATEGVIYDVASDGTCAVVGYSGSSINVRIADEYNGVAVTSIYENAFKNSAIASIIIPDTVTSIGKDAFYGCSALKNVTFGEGVVTIGDGAFQNCSALKTVDLPDSVTAIEAYAFYACSSLESVTFGEGLVIIGDRAFQYCTQLASVEIPETVKRVGNNAFTRCNAAIYTEYNNVRYVGSAENPYQILIEAINRNLSAYEIHEDTKIIAYSAFKSCTRLESISIPGGVRGIDAYAFSDCSSLASVSIPKSVVRIGSYAFANCSKIANVYYEGSAEDFALIEISNSGNYRLTDATVHYNN